MSEFDLVALDLDGTLLNSRDEVSPRNRRAIRAALDGGVRVVLVTGRGHESPARLAADLGLNLPVICAHGALTKDFLANRVLGHVPIPLQYAKPLIEFARATGAYAAVYSEERFYVPEEHAAYMKEMHVSSLHPVANLREILHTAPTLIRFLGKDSVKMLREGCSQLPLHYKYETWGEFEECAITSSEATKERALARLCADYNIPADRVLAIGDSRNDIPMLQWAGLGLAMANALPEVHEVIRTRTACAEDDGVALAIEKYVLAAEEKTA